MPDTCVGHNISCSDRSVLVTSFNANTQPTISNRDTGEKHDVQQSKNIDHI